MSWLYNHRHQHDGLRPLIEIAHWVVVFHVPPEDRDDVEQEVVINLIETVARYGNKPKSYLKAVARSRVAGYLHKKYGERRRSRHIFESGKGEIVRRMGELIRGGDGDARLDAIATLDTLPERLIQIGYKVRDGEKLSEADESYWRRQKEKLREKFGYSGRFVSDREKRQILRLHSKGMSMCKIARTVGRSNHAVMRVLAGSQPISRQDWLAKMKREGKERDERIRHAYFIEGKSMVQIAGELNHSTHTVRRAITESR